MRSKEISIGGYLPANSILHRLDPRTKLFGLMALLATVFLIPCSYKIFFPVLAAVLALLLSGLGWRVWIDGLRKFRLMLLITLILNFALNRDGLPIQFHGFVTPFSYDGLASAVFLTARIVLAVLFSLSLTFTTLPLQIVKGLQFFMSPLKMIGTPVADASLVLFLALRFVPMLQEEWLSLIEAQESRGIDLMSGTLSIRIRRLMSLIVPSMLLAFRKSEELSTAMTTRGFRPGEERTEYNPPVFSYIDFYAWGFILLVALSVIFL
ncbi:MAG: energy-coupling factor transporter transmembrane component T [Syntrophaceae bacterium]|nr:energy-coupling factor transporter transmembrane component T [Syntrophaceae bacterium]